MPITLLNNNNNMQSRYAGIFSFNANKWWLPIGILPSNVIAAYQFKGVASEADALLNQNDIGTYPLTKSGNPVWNQASGFFIPATLGVGLDNLALTTFESVFVRYSGIDTASYSQASIIAAANGYRLFAAGAQRTSNYTYGRKPSFIFLTSTSGTPANGVVYASAAYASGILGWNRGSVIDDNTLYINGIQNSVAGVTSFAGYNGNSRMLIGQSKFMDADPVVQSYTVQAVAFYNTRLTAAQALELSDAMAAL
jgi:hypothetical protein